MIIDWKRKKPQKLFGAKLEDYAFFFVIAENSVIWFVSLLTKKAAVECKRQPPPIRYCQFRRYKCKIFRDKQTAEKIKITYFWTKKNE